MTLRIVQITANGERTVGKLDENNQVHLFVKNAQEMDNSMRRVIEAMTGTQPKRKVVNNDQPNLSR